MTSAVSCLTWVDCASNELFADAIKSPSTSAAIVPIRPAPSLTTSLASEPRWWSGTLLRNNIPTSVPAKMHANAIIDSDSGLIIFTARSIKACTAHSQGTARVLQSGSSWTEDRTQNLAWHFAQIEKLLSLATCGQGSSQTDMPGSKPVGLPC